jgi:peptidoglycan-associated lipoprotein
MVTRRIGRTCGVVLALVVAPLLLSGCPKRPAMVGSAGAASTTHGPAVGTGGQKSTAPASGKTARTATGDVAVLRDIHFAVDRYDIQPRYQPILDKAAGWLRANAGARLVIEGHCDESGTVAHNFALGERRAQATRDYLVALGIDAARISIVSYGKDRPACSAPTDECRSQNRRAHLLAAR